MASMSRMQGMASSRSSDLQGGHIASLGAPGAGPLELGAPRQTAVGPDGIVYVAEYGNARVHRYTPDLADAGFFADSRPQWHHQASSRTAPRCGRRRGHRGCLGGGLVQPAVPSASLPTAPFEGTWGERQRRVRSSA